jgi:hypothetical protein
MITVELVTSKCTSITAHSKILEGLSADTMVGGLLSTGDVGLCIYFPMPLFIMWTQQCSQMVMTSVTYLEVFVTFSEQISRQCLN